MFSFIIFGSLLDKLTGDTHYKMIGFFLLTGICGNVFSEMTQAKYIGGIGASTAIYGIFGCLIGMMILNWNELEKS
jgi:rhomboid protease GluP